jgi:hypothetical protein
VIPNIRVELSILTFGVATVLAAMRSGRTRG